LERVAIVSSVLLLFALCGAAATASITGVCPDGSIYIVQRAQQIPCRDSKRVRPEDVPPIKPELLPRPYGWEVFHRRNDPNNPYNLIDAARNDETAPRASQPAPTATPAPPPQQASVAPPPVSAAPPAARLDLGLSPEDVRDLALIVEYSQQRAPATLVRGAEYDPPSLVLRVAQSGAFDARLRAASKRAGSPVHGAAVLFSAVANRDESFYANLTFVQGHMAFHPEPRSAQEVGVIDGRLGRLRPAESVLGYVVLPASMDLSQPMDIYWNDQQVTATLRP
jgi:hypothetical protein